MVTAGAALDAAPRALELPAQAGAVRDLVATARDSAALRGLIAGLGVSAVRRTAPCAPPPAWTPESSSIWLDFWRRHTRPAERDAAGTETWRLKANGPLRVLAPGEPPALAELAAPGLALLARGRTDAAAAALTLALAQAPELPDLHAVLAEVHAHRHRWVDAVRELGMAVRGAGDRPDLFDRMGDMMASAGSPADAALSWEKAAGLDGGTGARWRKAARGWRRAGRPERAAFCDRHAAATP